MMLAAAVAWLAALASYAEGRATTFDHPARDRGNTGGHACDLGQRRRGRSALAAQFYADGFLVAHRRLPCWSVLAVCLPRTGRCSLATVADRGPRHAAIDLWAPLARLLGSDGDELATWEVMP